jgi:hypothetical protein
MRFLMNTLLAHPIPPLTLMNALRQSGYARALAVVFVSSAKTRSRHQSFTGVGLNLWRQFNPASQSCWHAKIRIQNRSLASSAPHRARYFSQTLWQRQG